LPTRRQFLLATSVLGQPLASVVPLPALAQPRARLGLLQLHGPFIDEHDLKGSRARAFAALKSLLQRSLEEHGPLDWLATSALPLSGRIHPRLADQLSLKPECDELIWLRRFATEHALSLQLSAWYRDWQGEPAPLMLRFEPNDKNSVQPLRSDIGLTRRLGLALDTDLRPGSDLLLAKRCRRLGLHGAGIVASHGPGLPPGAPATHCGTTRFVDPGGRVQTQLPPGIEGCLAISL
jgi:hypothetical protein